MVTALALGLGSLAATGVAHGQAQALPDLSSTDYSETTIDLSSGADNLDWVKWGYPSLDVNDGPFNAQELTARVAMTGNLRLRQTRKATGGHPMGSLASVLPTGASTSESFWSYLRTGGTDFTWTGGDPVATSPGDVKVSGGLAILPGATPLGHAGWGFQLQVAAMPDLRWLDLYFDCPPNEEASGNPPSTSALVQAQIAALPEHHTRVCYDQSRRVQKVRVSFSSDPGVYGQSVSVNVTTEDQNGVTRPIVLMAAILREGPRGTGDAGIDAAAPDALGDGGTDGKEKDAGRSKLADRPMACALAGGPGLGPFPFDDAIAAPAAAGFALVMLRARRRVSR